MSAPKRLPEQQIAADPAASAWVSANAGSGKTAVLVDRIVRLLLGGAEPASLLCLTYTRAAAAEMNERLNGRLGAWATAADEALREELRALTGATPMAADLARARHLFALCLETPGGLKIQTIHAFCEAVLGRFPLEADIPARFSVIDDRTAGDMSRHVQDRLLRIAAAEPDGRIAQAIAAIAELAGDVAFAEVFDTLAALRREWMSFPLNRQTLNARVSVMRDALGLRPGETEDSIRAEVLAFVERFQLRRVMRALAQGGKEAKARAAALDEALAANTPEALWDAVFEICLTQKGLPRSKAWDNPSEKADSGIVEILTGLSEAVVALRDRLNAAFVAEATEHVYVLADPFFSAYEAGKAAKGLLDYGDLIERVETLVTKSGAAPWVLYKLDGGIDHILIDEAQDTSPQQWNIVRALAEEFFAGLGREAGRAHRPRTVFAVGDPKQSIYSFQGADPQSFLDMRAEMQARALAAEQKFEAVPLVRSFRTTAPPLTLVDAVFALPDMRGGVAEPGVDVRHEVERANHAGRVELWEPVRPDKSEKPDDHWALPVDVLQERHPKRQLGALIASRIAGMLARQEMLPSKGRPVEPGDIMILVRRRDALTEEIIRQLKNRGVPVSGADRLKLGAHMAAQDLLALANFALNPRDDLNLGGLLKSPLVGLTEEQLFEAAYGRDGALWDALAAKKDDPAFGAAYDRLSGILNRAGFAPPYEFFAHELNAKGARKSLVRRLGSDANDPIDEFLNLALAFELEHPPSLQGFVDWFARGGTEIKRDMDRGGGMVRVMTVHGAKGLEAEIVILPDTCQTPRKDRPDLIHAGNGILLWGRDASRDDPIRTALLDEKQARGMEEYRRLLYVALTRARDRLIVCGCLNKSQKGPDAASWYKAVETAMGNLNARAEPAEGDAQVWVLESEQRESPKPERAKDQIEAAAAAPAWLFAAAPADAVPARARPSDRSRGADEEAVKLGQTVHALLMRLGALTAIPPESLVRHWAETLGAHAALAEQAAMQALAVRAGKDFADLFVPDSRGELPFDVWLPNGVHLAGRFDRLVLTPDQVRVVEFKTAARPPETPKGLKAGQTRQIVQYAAAAGVLFPGRAVTAEMVWTAAPSRMTIPSPLLESWSRSA
jgi:ATP-dependent helicase/nuclease subunit A